MTPPMEWSDKAACRSEDPVLFDISGPDEPEDWTDRALCAQSDPEAWYPEKGNGHSLAKAICRRCEVIEPCLEYALAHMVHNDIGAFGIWGGTSYKQRLHLLAERREEAA